jgi:predicted RNase H-like nuclease
VTTPDVAEQVVGVDGYPRGWVALCLRDGRFERVALRPTFQEVLAEFPAAAAFGVDIPIGAGPRKADALARKCVGPRRASVFPAPTEEALRAGTFAETAGVSRQTFALFPKIREVAEHAADPRVIEVHPEVSFRALKGVDLESPKTSWNGFMERRRLLFSRARIDLPGELRTDAPLVDVLDAAAAAWSAGRYALGLAESLPDEARPGARGVIWY